MREACADCGQLDPTWASLNRGILLCQECCSVHRRMGRHVSWVRSLQQNWWSPTLLMMVEALSKAGANSVWEYSLLDQTTSPTGCKPSSHDVEQSGKEDFIRSKHEEQAYILRSEQEVDGPEGLGAQLHAAARTADLLTSLRLFSQGADPNFYHEEKGSCPLHVAAKANQILQVELLIVYGADLGRRDSAGRTPEDVARDSGHVTLAERLRSAIYHVFDRLLQYLCSRRTGPSGLNGLEELCLESGENNEARSKLESLSNVQFEKLVADVYDEVDRREAGLVWQGAESGAVSILDPVAFLPPHPALSATRNQGRQKLGRLSTRDFDQLIRDVLRDAKRRDISLPQGKQGHIEQNSPIQKLKTEISDDEPLYDSVASDEDYASTVGEPLTATLTQSQPSVAVPLNQSMSAISSNIPMQPVTQALFTQSQLFPTTSSFMHMNSIANNQSALPVPVEDSLRRSLMASEATIARLQSEVRTLHDQVAVLMKENKELRDEVTRCRSCPRAPELVKEGEENCITERIKGGRPTSMYETRDRPRNLAGIRGRSPVSAAAWPEYSDVIRRTDHVTKRIQELCCAMKLMDMPSLPQCAARIRTSLSELTSAFPQSPLDTLTSELTMLGRQLEMECACAASCPFPAQEQSLQRIRNIAYDIAKATKQLVVRAQTKNDFPT